MTVDRLAFRHAEGNSIPADRLIGQRQFWRKPSVIATRSVSEGLCLTRSLAYTSGYYSGKSGDVELKTPRNIFRKSLSAVVRF